MRQTPVHATGVPSSIRTPLPAGAGAPGGSGRWLRLEQRVQLGVVRRVPDHRVRLVEEEHSGEANPLSELQRRGLLPGPLDRAERRRAHRAARMRELGDQVVALSVLDDNMDVAVRLPPGR